MENIEVMSKSQQLSEFQSQLSPELSTFAVETLEKSPTSSKETLSWLEWCQNRKNVKVTSWTVPYGILPQGISITLHDVKVSGEGKRHVPDDKIYNNNDDIRDKVARGNTVLQIHDTHNKTIEYDMAVFALKKFTGGMGDEDEDQPDNDLVWQKYFLKPLEEVTKVVCMIKENGEAGHVSVRVIDDKFFFIAGSKNVHLMFRTAEHLENYTDGRFSVAKMVGHAWLQQLDKIQSSKIPSLLSFLHESKLTMIFEILCPAYQHVVDLSNLSQPHLKFLTFTRQYREGIEDKAHESLAAFSPDKCIDFVRQFGLDSANYEVIAAHETEQRMMKVRKGIDYEGEVLYFLDKNYSTIGLLKKKTTWYIILRAIREKVSYVFSTYKKNPGAWSSTENRKLLVKLNKRLEEIQKWLSLTDQEKLEWQILGKSFQNWLVEKLISSRGDIDKYSVRGNFPQLWKTFHAERNLPPGSEQSIVDTNLFSDFGDTVTATEHVGNTLEEPRVTSPVIVITDEVFNHTPHVTAFIVRNVDLLGKNLKKVQNALNKTNGKVCGNKKKAAIGLHDLQKLRSPELIYKLLTFDTFLNSCDEDEREKLTNSADSQTQYPTLFENTSPVSSHPIFTSERTKVTEDTENIFVEIASNKSEEVVEAAANAMILQFYHMGIKMNSVEKCVHIENVKVILPDGSLKLYPKTIQFEK